MQNFKIQDIALLDGSNLNTSLKPKMSMNATPPPQPFPIQKGQLSTSKCLVSPSSLDIKDIYLSKGFVPNPR